MNKTRALNGFLELPPEAQEQVMNFIDFLKERYKRTGGKNRKDSQISEESFVGIWADRDDMQDSTEWVRRIRSQEWSKQ